jgi:hypothetical protein
VRITSPPGVDEAWWNERLSGYLYEGPTEGQLVRWDDLDEDFKNVILGRTGVAFDQIVCIGNGDVGP